MKTALRLLVLAIVGGAAGVMGWLLGSEGRASEPVACIPPATIVSPTPGTTRVIYSLDERHNDEELVALIEAARSHISFAIYTFTLDSVADALIAAKARGVEVRGLVDSGQATKSFEKPLIERLVAAGIPILTEQHGSKGGIMHIKLLVTDRAYALGSYNWTASATKRNDEILEIGTDPTLRQTYENILRKLFTTYAPE